MINASYGGNYYTWSDSVNGICVGYKEPDSTCFTIDTICINWTNNNMAMHPSLNSYSRIELGENECALV